VNADRTPALGQPNTQPTSTQRPTLLPAPVINEFVIIGTTLAGDTFRPSDWAERLCGIMCQFGGDPRTSAYSPYVKPILSAGVKCVVVDERLKTEEPMAFTFLTKFARDNELKTRAGRNAERKQ
jgi:hypothetical protein